MFKKMKNEKGYRLKVTIIVLVFMILAASAACIVFISINTEVNNRIMDNATALEGVKVNGIDISGMDMDEALKATSAIPDELMSQVDISFNVEGESIEFTAQQLGITTGYEDVMKQALLFGNTGTLEERKQIIENTKTNGVDLTVTISADMNKIASVLLPLKETLDTQPVDATCVFQPWGHLSDGTPYDQDEQAMIEAAADNKMWERPELSRISEDEKPNALRYKFWENDKYIDGYIPPDANIARFLYTDGVNGRSVDMESVVDSVFRQIQSGNYSAITAPVKAIEPSVMTNDLKKDNGLVTSWTSSFSDHDRYNRIWNVAKMSGIISGIVIQPGEEWSINTEAGDRTSKAGWKDAAGIVRGGYVDQPGGGVCQISSTTYNAAIRAALDITESKHHSIPSDYIPFGLDATISSFGGPDLKIRNPYSTPVYLISYIDPKEKTTTVEIYGPTVVDAEYGDVILDFSFKEGKRYGSPVMTYVYNTTKTPNGKTITAGESYEYAKTRLGRKVSTYSHYLSLDGTELAKKEFHNYK